jgi:hypothetical protein
VYVVKGFVPEKTHFYKRYKSVQLSLQNDNSSLTASINIP